MAAHLRHASFDVSAHRITDIDLPLSYPVNSTVYIVEFLPSNIKNMLSDLLNILLGFWKLAQEN